MHTQHIGDTTFHHNGDMSGDVVIVRDHKEMHVPAKDLVEFVLDRVIFAVVSRIEGIDPMRVWRWLSK